MPKFIDLMAKKFGRWTVVELVGPSKWRCICECGQEAFVKGQSLRDGRSKSCGCLHRELTGALRFKHGQSNRNKTPTYTSWASMIQRCTNTNHRNYNHYGGRGITICDRWRNSFEAFLEDMGERPSLKYSIDRIKTNGNYEPHNCKWSTQTEQIRNRRTERTNGVSWDKANNKWRPTIRVSGKTINLGRFSDLELAIQKRKEAEIKYWGESS